MKHLRPILPACSIAAAAFLVYWPSLRNGFVWDDTALVLRDPLIRSWRLIREGFRHFLFLDATASNFYRPIQRLSYTVDYAFHEFGAWGYHLTNILLHAAAAVALFWFLKKWSSRNAMALLASLAWVVHPLHSSAVIYVAGRADLLAALFGFGALAISLGGRRRTGSITAAVCFFAAMLSKENGFLFLVAWLVILAFRRDYLDLQRWSFVAVLIVALYCGLRLTAQRTPPPPSPGTPVVERPMLAARAVAEYAGLLVAPVDLHMERDVRNRNDIQPDSSRALDWKKYQTLLGVMLLGLFMLWCRRAWHGDRLILQALILFALAYLPISNLLPLNASIAEHWLYVPSAFLLFAAMLSIDRLAWRKVLIPLVIVWACFLGVRTFLRNADWRDQRTFLKATIRSGGDSERMYVNLGQLEASGGHFDAALDALRKALELKPDSRFARMGRAAAYIRMRDYQRAKQELEHTLSDPFFRPKSLDFLATVQWESNPAEAVATLREAALLDKNYWPIRKRYIQSLDATRDTRRAIDELRELLEEQPYRADSWKLLGSLLLKIGQSALAREAFERAASYDVHDAASREEIVRLRSSRQ